MADGYEAEIPQGFWRRIVQYGLPTKWFAVWLMAAMFQVMGCLTLLPGWWGVRLALGLGIVGLELLLGGWLTRADAHWDTLVLETWRRRYSNYEAE